MASLATIWSSPLFDALLAALHVLLAALVTVDVLLKKSDVRAELGWIGAGWFSPIIGALLYFTFGINRVTRRALRLKRLGDGAAGFPAGVARPEGPANIVQLSEISGRVTGGPLAPGNSIAILEGGD